MVGLAGVCAAAPTVGLWGRDASCIGSGLVFVLVGFGMAIALRAERGKRGGPDPFFP